MIGQSTKVGSAHIELTAKTDRFARGMREMEDQARRSSSRVQSEIRKADTEIKRMTSSAGMLASVMSTLGGAMVGAQLIKIADTFTQIRGRLSLVVKEGENLLDVEERLFQLALKNRAAIEPTVALYARLRAARADLSDEQTLKIVDTWNKTLVISGASAGGAAAATIQLSQAMAGGVLRAEEFNSIVENNTRAVQLFAASLGVSMGELRAMVNEGKVGFDDLVKAMTTDAGAVGEEFGKMQMTVGQAMTNLETSMIRFIGLQDQQFEGSKKLAEWINILAQNFEVLATAILVAGASVATALGVGLLQSMAGAMFTLSKQMLAAGSAAKALGLAMKWMGGPWGIALGAIAAALGSIAFSMADLRTEAQKADDRLNEFDETLKSNAELIKKWELAIAADGLKSVGDAAKGAADGVDQLNAAMERSEKRMKIDTLTLQARIAQADAAITQNLLEYLKSPKVVADEFGSRNGDEFIGSADEIASTEAKLARQKQVVNDLLAQARILSTIPTDFAPDSVGKSPSGEKITKMAGYYTALERYETELAEIRKASAKGAEGGNRAVIQSMMDYLNAGGSLKRVLTDVQALSGNLLDPESVKIIEQFMTAMQVAETITVNEALETEVTNFIESEGPWQTFEQRIAEATRYGLLSAIETGEWGNAFGQILTDVTRDALNNALDVLWQALAQIDWGGQGTGWAGFLSMVGSSFSGGKASGGPVSAGNMYRVGEKGSEWFMPNVDGYIVPNNFKGRALQSQSIMIGAPVVNVYGNADSVTRAEIAETLGAFSRGLPTVIDARVRDRQMRGAY